jgi:hypothetical protein
MNVSDAAPEGARSRERQAQRLLANSMLELDAMREVLHRNRPTTRIAGGPKRRIDHVQGFNLR